jgi:dTDP-4-dehydrorhamnose reductase
VKILVTGGGGQLGKEFYRLWKKSFSVWAPTREQLNITFLEEIKEAISKFKPDVIIHSAAFTGVDHAENNILKAYEVNAIGTYNVAKATKELSPNSQLIYISTDYVFDGTKMAPYEITDKPKPISSYGQSKYLGELYVQELTKNFKIIRTSWLYGKDGTNFVNAIYKKAMNQEVISVVNDQHGRPTYTKDLVNIVYSLLQKEDGIYHVSNNGSCNWYKLARKIYELIGEDPEKVKPCTTKHYGAIAPRPAYSVLSLNSLVESGVQFPRLWEDALEDYLKEVQN